MAAKSPELPRRSAQRRFAQSSHRPCRGARRLLAALDKRAVRRTDEVCEAAVLVENHGGIAGNGMREDRVVPRADAGVVLGRGPQIAALRAAQADLLAVG